MIRYIYKKVKTNKNMEKRKKKKNSKNKKEKIIIISLIILLIVSVIIIIKIKNINPSGKTIKDTNVQITALNVQEINKIQEIILSSEFIKDVPKNDPISLTFYRFEDNKRVWQSSFLIGKNQLLEEGKPTIYLNMHSKYILELTSTNLCNVIKKANENGDLGFYSEYSKARLLLKYASMFKHRECLGA